MPFADRFPELHEGLRAAYAEPHRAYHNWSHVEAMLGHFGRLRPLVAAPEAMELAIYYHDAVCTPVLIGNEVRSARRLARELAGQVREAVLTRARRLVLATALHRVPALESQDFRADCALFLDMDLAILGSEREAFESYERAIRREFAAVPEGLYRTVRRGIFRRFLARPAIYGSEAFRRTHEALARANLRRALAEL